MALPETDLIHQYHNRHLLAFIAVLNQMKRGNTLSFRDLKKQIRQIAGDDFGWLDLLWKYLTENQYENHLFSISDDTIEKLSNNTFFLPMSTPEKIYLKNVLRSPYAVLFLEESLILSLLDKLSDVPDVDFSQIIDFAGVSSAPVFDETYIKNFQLLIQAIRKRKKIRFINTNRHGVKIKNLDRIPVKIEYSVLLHSFSLSLWNVEEQRPFKVNLERISQICLTGHISDTEYQNAMHMLEDKKKQTPILMRVHNKNNLFERISLFFSAYQKQTVRIDKNTAEISLFYYQFEEDEIIDGILSFGPSVQVLSPEPVIKKIQKKLCATNNFFQ